MPAGHAESFSILHETSTDSITQPGSGERGDRIGLCGDAGPGVAWDTKYAEATVDSIIAILLIVAAIKFVLFGIVLYFVFRPDLRTLLRRKRPQPDVTAAPVCMYCDSQYARATGEVQTRWEGNELVLVTTFECEHCHFPLWRVERIPVGAAKP